MVCGGDEQEGRVLC